MLQLHKILPINCEYYSWHLNFLWHVTLKLTNFSRIEKGLEKEGVLEFLENLAKLITPEYIDALYLKTYQILQEMGYTTDKLVRYTRSHIHTSPGLTFNLLFEQMLELMQPCNLMIRSCSWLGKIIPCESIFRVAKSSEGFCCSFNYKALKDSLEL